MPRPCRCSRRRRLQGRARVLVDAAGRWVGSRRGCGVPCRPPPHYPSQAVPPAPLSVPRRSPPFFPASPNPLSPLPPPLLVFPSPAPPHGPVRASLNSGGGAVSARGGAAVALLPALGPSSFPPFPFPAFSSGRVRCAHLGSPIPPSPRLDPRPAIAWGQGCGHWVAPSAPRGAARHGGLQRTCGTTSLTPPCRLPPFSPPSPLPLQFFAPPHLVPQSTPPRLLPPLPSRTCAWGVGCCGGGG